MSAYERAQDQPSDAFARAVATVFEMPELEVWRCLGLPLPAQAQTDSDLVAWAYEVDPGLMRRVVREVTGKDPGSKPPDPGRKSPHVTRKGDTKGGLGESRENAV